MVSTPLEWLEETVVSLCFLSVSITTFAESRHESRKHVVKLRGNTNTFHVLARRGDHSQFASFLDTRIVCLGVRESALLRPRCHRLLLPGHGGHWRCCGRVGWALGCSVGCSRRQLALALATLWYLVGRSSTQPNPLCLLVQWTICMTGSLVSGRPTSTLFRPGIRITGSLVSGRPTSTLFRPGIRIDSLLRYRCSSVDGFYKLKCSGADQTRLL